MDFEDVKKINSDHGDTEARSNRTVYDGGTAVVKLSKVDSRILYMIHSQ